MRIFVVDVETDSVKPQLANILEIGMASVDLDTGQIELLFDTLVCPPGLDGMEPWLNCWFMQNSHVDPDLIRKAPKLADIKTGIEAYLALGPVTAYNLSFDLAVLNHNGIETHQTWPCLMQTAKFACKIPGKFGYKLPKFSEAWAFFYPNEPFEEKHRAAYDAMHEAQLALSLSRRGYFWRQMKK
jgi:DNA polymerase III alpha subunit (gram-positive type)